MLLFVISSLDLLWWRQSSCTINSISSSSWPFSALTNLRCAGWILQSLPLCWLFSLAGRVRGAIDEVMCDLWTCFDVPLSLCTGWSPAPRRSQVFTFNWAVHSFYHCLFDCDFLWLVSWLLLWCALRSNKAPAFIFLTIGDAAQQNEKVTCLPIQPCQNADAQVNVHDNNLFVFSHFRLMWS